MKSLTALALTVMCLAAQASSTASDEVFEVKAKAVDKIYYQNGKVEKEAWKGDEVTYLVNLPKNLITRTAVYNANMKDDILGGLQSDASEYTIVHNEGPGLGVKQHLIKAFGKVGAIDGYETIIIGQDFVTTSRTSGTYFALMHYNRTDLLAEEYRRKQEKR